MPVMIYDIESNFVNANTTGIWNWSSENIILTGVCIMVIFIVSLCIVQWYQKNERETIKDKLINNCQNAGNRRSWNFNFKLFVLQITKVEHASS